MSQKPLRVAIIGGGISGLATAYYLINPQVPGRAPCEVTIFEAKEHLGGNAETPKVKLGRDVASGEDIIAWCDLGVNDFNTKTYTSLMEIMDDIGFKADIDHRPLEDTISYFTQDGSVLYTDDEYLLKHDDRPKQGFTDPRFDLNFGPDGEAPHPLKTAFSEFMQAAAGDALKPEYRLKSMEDYFNEYIDKHHCIADLLEQVREHLLYPRINAMYFTDDKGPATLPLRSAMSYYILQEGYDPDHPPEPDRRYFTRGAQPWIQQFADHLKKNGVKIVSSFNARFSANKDGVLVWHLAKEGLIGRTQEQHFDKVILTCHADDALRCFAGEGLTDAIAQVLSRINYTRSIAVCHTYAGLLPPNRNAWRSYNVLIHQGTSMNPYTMSYVCNRHQNDAELDCEGRPVKPERNKVGLPQFFVTENPLVPIPDDYVLEVCEDGKRAWAGYPRLGGHESQMPGKKATIYFKHNVLDFACLAAQELLPSIQGGEHDNIYFAGGWTKGAGLHEECCRQGRCVTELIHDPDYKCPDDWNAKPEAGEEYAPAYVRSALRQA